MAVPSAVCAVLFVDEKEVFQYICRAIHELTHNAYVTRSTRNICANLLCLADILNVPDGPVRQDLCTTLHRPTTEVRNLPKQLRSRLVRELDGLMAFLVGHLAELRDLFAHTDPELCGLLRACRVTRFLNMCGQQTVWCSIKEKEFTSITNEKPSLHSLRYLPEEPSDPCEVQNFTPGRIRLLGTMDKLDKLREAVYQFFGFRVACIGLFEDRSAPAMMESTFSQQGELYICFNLNFPEAYPLWYHIAFQAVCLAGGNLSAAHWAAASLFAQGFSKERPNALGPEEELLLSLVGDKLKLQPQDLWEAEQSNLKGLVGNRIASLLCGPMSNWASGCRDHCRKCSTPVVSLDVWPNCQECRTSIPCAPTWVVPAMCVGSLGRSSHTKDKPATIAEPNYFRKNLSFAIREFLSQSPQVRAVQVRPAGFASIFLRTVGAVQPPEAPLWVVTMLPPATALRSFDKHPVLVVEANVSSTLVCDDTELHGDSDSDSPNDWATYCATPAESDELSPGKHKHPGQEQFAQFARFRETYENEIENGVDKDCPQREPFKDDMDKFLAGVYLASTGHPGILRSGTQFCRIDTTKGLRRAAHGFFLNWNGKLYATSAGHCLQNATYTYFPCPDQCPGQLTPSRCGKIEKLVVANQQFGEGKYGVDFGVHSILDPSCTVTNVLATFSPDSNCLDLLGKCWTAHSILKIHTLGEEIPKSPVFDKPPTFAWHKEGTLVLMPCPVSGLEVGVINCVPMASVAPGQWVHPAGHIFDNQIDISGCWNYRVPEMENPTFNSPGNSGSPLLDLKGNIVGIIHSQCNGCGVASPIFPCLQALLEKSN
eukprot:TRINITY_DN5257_c0_g1_i1.p1 TRINITY_DN5257_c0_g1~~TRINITY_DN5257_c0_g1_i1.p1  ORF type:complete len:825 (-),score=116.48 TRINITY_DN5257_c0_g1_i1:131-2605(-)